jgi:hypothetical protein
LYIYLYIYIIIKIIEDEQIDDADSTLSDGEVIPDNTESKREQQLRVSRVSKCRSSKKPCLSLSLNNNLQNTIDFKLCPQCNLEEICVTCFQSDFLVENVKCSMCVSDQEIENSASLRNNDIRTAEDIREHKLQGLLHKVYF